MKSALCLLFLLLAWTARAIGPANIYIAQTAQGGDTGLDAADAHSVAWFNTAGNWGNGASQISPGCTVHLCGTITTPLIVQGDGTAGNVTTILFESGANIAMLNLSAYGIDFNGHNYITVDGGVNGVIAGVDNGTTNTYQIIISGVQGHNVANDTVQNLTITNLFIRTANSTDSFGDQGPCGITFYGNCANCTVRNCSISWAHTCVNLGYSSGNSSNFQVYSNLLKWCNWGVLDGGGANGLLSGLSIHDNTISGCHVWDDPANIHHHNGIFVFAMNTASWAGNLSIYNNFIGPDWGAGHSTAGIYLEAAGTSDTGITNSLIYNNVAFSGAGLNCPDDAFVTLSHVNGARIYNNTFDGSTEGGRGVLTAAGANVTLANNIFSRVDPIEWEESNAIVSSDYNDFCSPVGWSFSIWQGQGYDAHGTTGDPQFVNAAAYNFNIQAGSAAKDAGTSESAYFAADILGTSRPQGSAWDIGAYELTATTYYAATNGSSGNTGLSTNSPWPLDYALAHCGASNIVMALPGNYGAGGFGPSFDYVTVKSQVKWGARIVGGNPGLYSYPTGTGVGTTFDGFHVSGASNNCVWLVNSNCIVRNCWLDYAGASGLEAHPQNGTLVEDCLFEHNGSHPTQHHGAYLAGTNITFRNNVSRYNGASGINIGDDTGPSDLFYCYHNVCYSNGTWAGVVAGGALTGCRSCVFGNTFCGSSYAVGAGNTGGSLLLSNNILIGQTSPVNLWGNGSVAGDYNLMNSAAFTQAHGIITNWPGFVNSSHGLYWLTNDSPARGMALVGVCGSADFFGKSQSSIADVGAFQYGAVYAADSRVLDPSPANPDYWAVLAPLSPAFQRIGGVRSVGDVRISPQ